LNYDRLSLFAKELDAFLEMPRLDYAEVKRRSKDAVKQLYNGSYEDLSKQIQMTRQKHDEVLSALGAQGFIILIYTRNYTWKVAELRKKSTNFLERLSSLLAFMQSTLNSRGIDEDYLFSQFELTTFVEIVPAYGCFAKMSNKAGLINATLPLDIPARQKSV
jgi:hypothetical protein